MFNPTTWGTTGWVLPPQLSSTRGPLNWHLLLWDMVPSTRKVEISGADGKAGASLGWVGLGGGAPRDHIGRQGWQIPTKCAILPGAEHSAASSCL